MGVPSKENKIAHKNFLFLSMLACEEEYLNIFFKTILFKNSFEKRVFLSQNTDHTKKIEIL